MTTIAYPEHDHISYLPEWQLPSGQWNVEGAMRAFKRRQNELLQACAYMMESNQEEVSDSVPIDFIEEDIEYTSEYLHLQENLLVDDTEKTVETLNEESPAKPFLRRLRSVNDGESAAPTFDAADLNVVFNNGKKPVNLTHAEIDALVSTSLQKKRFINNNVPSAA